MLPVLGHLLLLELEVVTFLKSALESLSCPCRNPCWFFFPVVLGKHAQSLILQQTLGELLERQRLPRLEFGSQGSTWRPPDLGQRGLAFPHALGVGAGPA